MASEILSLLRTWPMLVGLGTAVLFLAAVVGAASVGFSRVAQPGLPVGDRAVEGVVAGATTDAPLVGEVVYARAELLRRYHDLDHGLRTEHIGTREFGSSRVSIRTASGESVAIDVGNPYETFRLRRHEGAIVDTWDQVPEGLRFEGADTASELGYQVKVLGLAAGDAVLIEAEQGTATRVYVGGRALAEQEYGARARGAAKALATLQWVGLGLLLLAGLFYLAALFRFVGSWL